MTNEQKLKANIAAARMLGHRHLDILTDEVRVLGTATQVNGWRFDIFTNPADCLAVVKKLLTVHDHTIQYYTFDKRYYYKDSRGRASDFSHDTYEEAVGAACLEIKETREGNFVWRNNNSN